MRVRYEDFVEEPRRVVEDILSMVREEDAELSFTNGASRSVNHTASGNSNRFQTGSVQLRSDTEWAYRMRTRDKTLVTLLTLPLLTRYGLPAIGR